MARLAFVRSSKDATTIGGVLGNISPDGVLIDLHIPADDAGDELPVGLRVDLIIDEFPALSGTVARVEPNAIAVHLTLESRAQRDLGAVPDNHLR